MNPGGRCNMLKGGKRSRAYVSNRTAKERRSCRYYSACRPAKAHPRSRPVQIVRAQGLKLNHVFVRVAIEGHFLSRATCVPLLALPFLNPKSTVCSAFVLCELRLCAYEQQI